MIISLQEKHGNQWTLITKRVNETFETERGVDQVGNRFIQLEKESKQGGRMRRRVDFTTDEEDRLIAFRDDWLKTHNNSTYGMWDAMLTKFTEKTKDDLKNHWNRHLKLSVATSTAVTSSAESTKAVSKAVSKKKKSVAKKVTAMKAVSKAVSKKKAVAKKVTATKVAPVEKQSLLAMPALSPVIPSWSSAMPALSPVVGLDPPISGPPDDLNYYGTFDEEIGYPEMSIHYDFNRAYYHNNNYTYLNKSVVRSSDNISDPALQPAIPAQP